MDDFIEFLEDNKADKKIINKFKKKINKPIEYKLHLERYEFSEKWFSILDDILVELGYRALDADIKYIRIELKKLITDTNVNKIINRYNIEYKTNIKPLTNFDYVCQSLNLVEIVEYLIDHPDKIDWVIFSKNKLDSAVKYMIKNPDKIDRYNFVENESDIAIRYMSMSSGDFYYDSKNESDYAVCYLLEHQDKICWSGFSLNKNHIAICYLIEHPDKISWYHFSANTEDMAVRHLTDEHPDKISWDMFSKNENSIAVHYLIYIHPDKIDWWYFMQNTSDIAVCYCIEKQYDHILSIFSRNESDIAVRYLVNNPHNINKHAFSYNKSYIAVIYLISKYRNKIHHDNAVYNRNNIMRNFLNKNYSYEDYYTDTSIYINIIKLIKNSCKFIYNSVYNYFSYGCYYELQYINKIKENKIEYLLENQHQMYLDWDYIFGNLNQWKIDKFNKLNWFPKSGLKL